MDDTQTMIREACVDTESASFYWNQTKTLTVVKPFSFWHGFIGFLRFAPDNSRKINFWNLKLTFDGNFHLKPTHTLQKSETENATRWNTKWKARH